MLDQSVSDVKAAGKAKAQALIETRKSWLENDMAVAFEYATIAYPILSEADLRHMLPRFSQKRMASDLDVTRYPECGGMAERVRAMRRGAAEVITDPLLAAFYHDWGWFGSRRLNTRFVAAAPPPPQCTRLFFADTAEGGEIQAGNIDNVLMQFEHDNRPPPQTGPAETRFEQVTQVGAVSSAVLCDEEPECLFPVDMAWIMPSGMTDIHAYVDMLARYMEFWGPFNGLYVAPDMRCAVIEKANVRMGVRYSDGWGAITAGAYLDPAMHAFKESCSQRSFEVRGWGADNPDAVYWDGCEKRYRRLLSLAEAEHQRGATLLGAARITLDHAVPFPERICLAGERGHPEEKLQNWSMLSSAEVSSGPNRRSLFWKIDPEDLKPIYHTRCHVRAGAGLEARQQEFEAEIEAAGEIGA